MLPAESESPSRPEGPRIARAGETFGELVVLDLAASYAATAVACEPTALYMIEQATLYDRFASMPEVLNKMRQRAAQTHKDGVYSKLPESGEEAPQVRAKNMRSSLVGGGGATLPTGFADTMLTLLSDVQRRLATIDHRLDTMERRIDGDDAEAPCPRLKRRAHNLQPSHRRRRRRGRRSRAPTRHLGRGLADAGAVAASHRESQLALPASPSMRPGVARSRPTRTARRASCRASRCSVE